MEYLRKKWSGKKASAPTLERKHHKYFLRFSYTEEVSLSKTDVKEQVICSVDLGINTDAVCSIMRADGTILGRKFINFSSDKDHLYHVLGRIRRFQREHSSRQVQSRWDYAKRLNMELSRKIAAEITKYAVEYQARRYALEGILGTVQLFLQSEKHLENLKDDVCSPAGPAMIGVKTLEDRGFRSSVINAVVDAYKRFDEIGKLK